MKQKQYTLNRYAHPPRVLYGEVDWIKIMDWAGALDSITSGVCDLLSNEITGAAAEETRLPYHLLGPETHPTVKHSINGFVSRADITQKHIMYLSTKHLQLLFFYCSGRQLFLLLPLHS